MPTEEAIAARQARLCGTEDKECSEGVKREMQLQYESQRRNDPQYVRIFGCSIILWQEKRLLLLVLLDLRQRGDDGLPRRAEREDRRAHGQEGGILRRDRARAREGVRRGCRGEVRGAGAGARALALSYPYRRAAHHRGWSPRSSSRQLRRA